MKTKIVAVSGVLVALLAVVAIAILLSPSLPPRQWAVGVTQWKLSEPISVTTRAERFGVQKGDAFPYIVEVWYNPAVVAEIDKTSLDKGINLAPFEVRRILEREFSASSKMRVYQREYEIQLIEGEVNHLYEFPAIVIRYKPKDSAGLLNVGANAQPVFVAARLPADIGDLELRPIAPTVTDLVQRNLPWILWGIGAFLAALGAADLIWRVIPQWRGAREGARKAWEDNVVAEAYRSLHGNVAMAIEPQRLFHQMDHLLRVALASKDNLDWLEEPDIDHLPTDIKEPVASLLEKCEKAYRPADIEQEDVAEALRLLDATLGFYFGKQEVEAWRS